MNRSSSLHSKHLGGTGTGCTKKVKSLCAPASSWVPGDHPFFWQGPLPPASDGVGLPGIASTRTSANTAALISHSWEPSLAHFSGNLIKEEVELSDKEINLIEVQLRLVRGNAAARAHANIVNAFFVCILERVYFGSCKVC